MKKRKRGGRLLSLFLVFCLALSLSGSASAQKREERLWVSEEQNQGGQLWVSEELEKGEQLWVSEELEKGEQLQISEEKVSAGDGKLRWTEDQEDDKAGIEAKALPQTRESIDGKSGEVRVFIVLEGESALEEGHSAQEFSGNALEEDYSVQEFSGDMQAQDFSEELEARQEYVLEDIQRAVRQDQIQVRYQYSVVANAFSAEVKYKDIDKIKEVEGVKDVYLVPSCSLQQTAVPNTLTAGEMVGSYETWDSGYTGAGQRIAIVDTGIDVDHPSFDAGAFAYGREMTQKKTGHDVSEEELLGAKDIAKVFGKLKAGGKRKNISPGKLYINEKIAFAFNYSGNNLDVSHEGGDHGTHVAGIAAANQYVPAGDGTFQEQKEGVAGFAKDAQLLVMKVFADGDEAYLDDYMAAVEDALLLEADVVNLSLGTLSPGESAAFSGEEYVNKIFSDLLKSDMVVSVSAGNNGAWADASSRGHNRAEDVNMNMVGNPGSYTNALTVASAVNAGYTGSGFRVGKRTYFYRDAVGAANIPSMATLDTEGKGTEYEYVFLESFGEEKDYANIDVNGKVVFVSRGIISYGEKHENAQRAGAAALFIYNDADGYIKMDLSGSSAVIPCAMIGWEDSWSLQAEGKEGTMCILSEPVENSKRAEGYRMSEFSSWGVPGDLSLKPEITAPGESIYAPLDGGEYGSMSGTSMATPGIAGMSALVSEYVQRNGLEEKTGLSRRALIQSLLMGTAVPLREKDKEEYSPRKQGSGLANVHRATTTPTYLLVGGKKSNDGKVKAELGDDPKREGVYEFSFRVCNISEEDQYYTLDSSVLTEELLSGKWVAGSSHKLQPKVTFSSRNYILMYDLNGDGKVNKEDARELLRHVNRSVSFERVEQNLDKFDFHKDGVIDTADVYGFLRELNNPASGFGEKVLQVKEEAQVSVKMALSQADKAYLDKNFARGMYIDGFIYLKGAVELSIPMLAFYGNWTESSMFEPFDYLQFANGGKTERTYSGVEFTNYLKYYMAEEDREFCYGSNMYLQGGDKEYLPERNAFSTNSGDRISGISYSLIRNAAVVRTSVVNDKTGEIYYQYQEGNYAGAYYDSRECAWINKEYVSVLDWQGLDKQGKPLPEGTQVRIEVQALPEYYRDKPKKAAEGATFSVPLMIDNTKPELLDMKAAGAGKIRLTFQDNRFTAAVKVYDKDKQTLLKAYGVNQQKPGVSAQLTIEDPQKPFTLKLVDYAGNTVSYQVEQSGSGLSAEEKGK